MKIVTPLLALILALSFATSSYAQRGNSNGIDVNQSLNELEAEYLRCLDQQEAIYGQIEQWNKDLEKLHHEHNRAQGKDKTRLSQQIDRINNSNRNASISIARISLELQRIKLGIDRLTRFDSNQNRGHNSLNRTSVKAIRNLTFKREGPVRVNGRLGFNDTNVWEITFDDGRVQRLEDRSFTPIR